MTTTQQPPATGTATAPTAAQRVVSAMWAIGKPATAKAISEAAGVGYSTVSPILRNLLADNQAVKTDGATGQAEWQLTATLPNPPATDTHSNTDSDSDVTDSFGGAEAASVPEPGDPAGTDSAVESADDGNDGSDGDDGDDGSPDDDTPGSEPDSATAGNSSPQSSDPAAQGTSRAYRKPELPRRPKGHLRAAVLAVLTEAPEQGLKVSQVCKAIDAANTDGSYNKAGAGAVANALDKLVISGDLVRADVVRADGTTVATYRSTRTAG